MFSVKQLGAQIEGDYGVPIQLRKVTT